MLGAKSQNSIEIPIADSGSKSDPNLIEFRLKFGSKFVEIRSKSARNSIKIPHPEFARISISINGSNFVLTWSIFIRNCSNFYRDCRPAAHRAEPPFLLAGAALRPCFSLDFLVQNCSKFDQIFDSRSCSNLASRLAPNCSDFDPYFDLSSIKIARNSMEIPIPKLVRISSAQNCSNFAQNCLNFDGWGTSGARWARSRSSPGTPWVPWGAQGGSRDRFCIDFGCPGD